MKSKPMNWFKNRSLLAFFVLAYAFSWAVEIPLALTARGIIKADIPFSLHYLAAYGPMASALIVTGVTRGSPGLRDLSDLGRLAGHLAWFFGATGAIAQMFGLLRWPFVVPVLAQAYTDPQATEATREAVAAAFQVVHQYGGVVLGEHVAKSSRSYG